MASLRFVMPHDPSMRPAWMIRTGLFLYDHLGRREVLPGSRGVDLRNRPAGASLQPDLGQPAFAVVSKAAFAIPSASFTTTSHGRPESVSEGARTKVAN